MSRLCSHKIFANLNKTLVPMDYLPYDFSSVGAYNLYNMLEFVKSEILCLLFLLLAWLDAFFSWNNRHLQFYIIRCQVLTLKNPTPFLIYTSIFESFECMTLSHLFVLQNCLLNNLMTLYLYLVTRLNPITMSSELELSFKMNCFQFVSEAVEKKNCLSKSSFTIKKTDFQKTANS